MRTPVVLLLLVACGPSGAELVGTYEGMLTSAPVMPGGSCPASSARTEPARVQIVAGPALDGFGSCKKVELEPALSSAKVKPVTCPPDPNVGIFEETKISGGSLALQAKALTVSITYRLGTGCEIAVTGTLTKK